MSDNVKFIPVITQNLDGFAKQDGQIVVDVVNNKIAVDVNSERFVVANKPAIDASISTLDTKLTNNITQVDTKYAGEIATINANKQDKLITGDNITIAEDGKTISAIPTTNYDTLIDNKPIINADLDAEDFIPEIGTYYRHTGTGGGAVSGTPFAVGDNVSKVYFDTTSTPDFSAFTLQQGENVIAEFGDEDALLIVSDLTNVQAGFYLIAIADIPIWSSINFSTFTAGWQSNITSTGGVYSFEDTYSVTELDSTVGWNGVWCSKTAFAPSSQYTTGTIYKCISSSPATYSRIALESDITNEANLRQQADSTLQGHINTVTNNLETEVTARQNADTQLQNTKQDKLMAGNNITIDSSNNISAVDTKYSAGDNIEIYNWSGEAFNSTSNPVNTIYFNRYLSNTELNNLCEELANKYGDSIVLMTNQSSTAKLRLWRYYSLVYFYNLIYIKDDSTSITLYNNAIGWSEEVAADGSFSLGEQVDLIPKADINGWNGKLAGKSLFTTQPTITAKTAEDVLLAANNTVKKIWTGTQAQYDAITTKEPTTLYIIKEA